MIEGTKTKPLTIGRLAQEAGINLETVRFYERKGLLPKPPRSTPGYRLFPADAARRLRFIKRAQELGFSLSEIRELLTLRLSPHTNSKEIRKRTDAKIADIEGKLTPALNVAPQVATLPTRASIRARVPLSPPEIRFIFTARESPNVDSTMKSNQVLCFIYESMLKQRKT